LKSGYLLRLDRREVLMTLAAILYERGKLTLRQAAELAGLNIEEFLIELGKRRVSFTNITAEDLREELDDISSS